MTVYTDTSAFLAVLDADDQHHPQAKKSWGDLINENRVLVCSSYVLVEILAISQHRLGLGAVRAFQEDIYPILQIEWIDQDIHQAAITGVLTAATKKLSFVDCVSFEVMRRLGIKTAFTFDHHFRNQGFECIP